MASETQAQPYPEGPAAPDSVEMPRPTAAPLVLALGRWVGELLPGRGHVHEPLAEPPHRPRPVTAAPGGVEQMRPGLPGYRLRLPEQVHPVSAGLKGGLVGGLLMPLPAIAWG